MEEALREFLPANNECVNPPKDSEMRLFLGPAQVGRVPSHQVQAGARTKADERMPVLAHADRTDGGMCAAFATALRTSAARRVDLER
jgi:hypothetical protein